jgi:hypothetical protein
MWPAGKKFPETSTPHHTNHSKELTCRRNIEPQNKDRRKHQKTMHNFLLYPCIFQEHQDLSDQWMFQTSSFQNTNRIQQRHNQ